MKYFLIIIFTFFLNVSQSQTYFDKYQKLADSLETIYGIPSSVMMAIAYHESGGGKRYIAKHSNNHFGIKGKNRKHKSSYRYFESDTASYMGFCDLISKRVFYGKLKGENDPKKWVSHISKSGYAGNPSKWGSIIYGIISKKKLT